MKPAFSKKEWTKEAVDAMKLAIAAAKFENRQNPTSSPVVIEDPDDNPPLINFINFSIACPRPGCTRVGVTFSASSLEAATTPGLRPARFTFACPSCGTALLVFWKEPNEVLRVVTLDSYTALPDSGEASKRQTKLLSKLEKLKAKLELT